MNKHLLLYSGEMRMDLMFLTCSGLFVACHWCQFKMLYYNCVGDYLPALIVYKSL